MGRRGSLPVRRVPARCSPVAPGFATFGAWPAGHSRAVCPASGRRGNRRRGNGLDTRLDTNSREASLHVWKPASDLR